MQQTAGRSRSEIHIHAHADTDSSCVQSAATLLCAGLNAAFRKVKANLDDGIVEVQFVLRRRVARAQAVSAAAKRDAPHGSDKATAATTAKRLPGPDIADEATAAVPRKDVPHGHDQDQDKRKFTNSGDSARLLLEGTMSPTAVLERFRQKIGEESDEAADTDM